MEKTKMGKNPYRGKPIQRKTKIGENQNKRKKYGKPKQGKAKIREN